jgi:AcrR family transcriptional regulator
MGRPPEFDRAQALVRAMHLFWEQGYERTTIRDLTAVMGISAPSLYNAFGDKKRLFDEAVAEYGRSGPLIVDDVPDVPITRRVLAAMLAEAVREYSAEGRPQGCFVISDPVLAEQRSAGREVLRLRLRQAYDAGVLTDPDDIEPLADYIDLVLRGLSALARDGVDREALQSAADVALRAWPGR